VSIDIPSVLERLCHRYPSLLVDRIVEHEPGVHLTAIKNVTVNEEFFQGHFPGTPLMPGVLMIEAFGQLATLLVLHAEGERPSGWASLRGIDKAKFRRQVVPGDQLELRVVLLRRRGPLAIVEATGAVAEHIVAEARLLMVVAPESVRIDPTASVHPAARLGEGTVVGPNVSIGEHVQIGRRCRIGASSVLDGWTSIGDDNEVFPFASIGLIPQDLKFQGEQTQLIIGAHNVFREFVTINRGTRGGGGLTEIGHDNVFMAYAHVAHDCRIGRGTIFGNAATLAGHVLVDDHANIGAFTGVHQFCRIGRHAFIGGYSVITKDALPFSKTVGNRASARNYGVNIIGLTRRGFEPEVIEKLKRAYRYLLQSKLNTSRAVERIENDPELRCDEVQCVVDFIRTSRRGVILRRVVRRTDEVVVDD
jgi:UDP-N-acetylglucosamine acyltransferase